MDDQRLGSTVRALRRRRGWRQADLAQRAGVSQQFVSDLEAGWIGRMDLSRARHVAGALGVSIELVPRWRGPSLDQLLDRDHARLVDIVASELRRLGWDVLMEWTFNHFGERGSIDLLGWQRDLRSLAVIEVKTRLVDVQALLGGVDRKARLAPLLLAEERDWHARSIGRMLVLPAGSTSRDALERHRSSLGAAFPARNVAVHRWLREPSGHLSGVWFVRDTAGRGTPRGEVGASTTRVRTARSASAPRPA